MCYVKIQESDGGSERGRGRGGGGGGLGGELKPPPPPVDREIRTP